MYILKLLLATFAIIILVIVAVVSIFIVTFDANEYKQDISAAVNSKTGRELVFKGDVSLTLLPSLGMKLGSVSFSNAPGFGDKPMLAVNNASVSVDVFSLFSFNPQIAEFIMDGLTINLQRNNQGVTNWDDLVTKHDQQPADDDKAVVIKSEADFNMEGVFGGLAITDVNLLWSDAKAGVEYQVNIISLLTGKITGGQSFPLQLTMNIQSMNEFSSTIELSSDVLLGKKKLTLSSLALQSSAQGELIPVDKLSLKVAGDVEFSQSTGQLSIKAFNSQINTTGGALDSSKTSLAGEIGFDLNKQQLTIAVLDVQTELLGEAVPNGKMNTAFSARQLNVLLNERAVILEDLVLALNENKFKGYVKVKDYAQPDIEFKLKTEHFDVDKLMGETDKVPEVVPANEPVPAEDVEILLPMEFLRSLKLDGQLEVGTLVAQGLTINNVLLDMNAKNGLVSLDPIKMDLYEGSYAGVIKINAQGRKPEYTVRQKLSSFQIGLFLQDFMDDDKVSGNANLNMNLVTRGEWLSKLKSNLNGDLGILIKDGSLKGFNFKQQVELAKAKLRREKEPEVELQKTDFSALSLSGLIKDGVFSSNDLDMKAPLIRVSGKGSADLANETIDYLVNAKLVATSKGQDGGKADDLTGLAIPVAITGSWLAPKIDVQLDEMLKAKFDAEKAKIRQSIAQQKAELGKKLEAEKAKLKASQKKELDAKKRQLEKKRELAEAEQKAKLKAKQQEEKEKAKKKLADKLKKLF